MIKAEDLRIGDIVRVNKNDSIKNGLIGKVTDIDSLREYKEKKGAITLNTIEDDGWYWGIWCCNIEPIPLTPEILEKNGFKEDVVGECYTKSLDNETHPLARYLSVEWKSNSWSVFIKYRRLHDIALLRHIQHVHELQNTLWGVLGFDANLKI